MKKRIQQIKEKIKSKPKLYKALKILQKVCNILAYGFSIFTILGLLLGQSCTYKKADAVSKWENYYFAGLMELNSAEKWEQMAFALFGNNTFTYCYEYGETGYQAYTATNSFTSNFSFCNDMTTLYTLGWNDQTNPNIYSCRTCQFIVNRATTTQRYCDFAIYFQFNNLGSRYIEYRKWDSDYYATTNTSGNVVNIFTTNSSKNECCIFTTNSILYDYFVPTANNDYDNGLELGYVNGYGDGYQDGYDDGIYNNGVSTNPFNLIRNAFTAVAGILDIEVIPHLSLGVLIFAPLIVLLIIVIYRMFKG